jgi:hypothetical protein
MAKVLRDAIAYRHDFAGREDWAGIRKDSIPVGCPSGCWVEYDLLVSERASGEDVLKWVEAVLDRMENQHPIHQNILIL